MTHRRPALRPPLVAFKLLGEPGEPPCELDVFFEEAAVEGGDVLSVPVVGLGEHAIAVGLAGLGEQDQRRRVGGLGRASRLRRMNG